MTNHPNRSRAARELKEQQYIALIERLASLCVTQGDTFLHTTTLTDETIVEIMDLAPRELYDENMWKIFLHSIRNCLASKHETRSSMHADIGRATMACVAMMANLAVREDVTAELHNRGVA